MNKDLEFLLLVIVASVMGFMVISGVWSLVIYWDQMHYLLKSAVISLLTVPFCIAVYISIKIGIIFLLDEWV